MTRTTRLERSFQEASKKQRMSPWFGGYLIVLCLGLWIGLVEDLEPMTQIYALSLFLTGQTILALLRVALVRSLVQKLDQELAVYKAAAPQQEAPTAP